MRRYQKSTTYFNKARDDYENGFGDPFNDNYWIGLKYIQWFTADKVNVTLRVELMTSDGYKFYIEYDKFRLTKESSNFVLHYEGVRNDCKY